MKEYQRLMYALALCVHAAFLFGGAPALPVVLPEWGLRILTLLPAAVLAVLDILLLLGSFWGGKPLVRTRLLQAAFGTTAVLFGLNAAFLSLGGELMEHIPYFGLLTAFMVFYLFVGKGGLREETPPMPSVRYIGLPQELRLPTETENTLPKPADGNAVTVRKQTAPFERIPAAKHRNTRHRI
ncbi:MAG: hypothetical protein LBR73_02490 [Oscillospiraceae bacterium]|jgi:hypothetical protein|nr:hypothetical protein [Oscillospiraceae bacterium]